jgi:uncharacterized membrane protein
VSKNKMGVEMHKSTKWLIWEIGAVLLMVAILGLFHHPLLFSYQWHKLLHVLGAILFVGNIIITGVWMFMAERTSNSDVMRFAARMVNRADVFFTVPGIFLLITNGNILSERWGGVFRVHWIVASLALFAFSGIVWMGLLLRYQNSLITLSESARGEKDSPRFFSVLHKWYFWGAIAAVLPLASLVLMVLKPRLW